MWSFAIGIGSSLVGNVAARDHLILHLLGMTVILLLLAVSLHLTSPSSSCPGASIPSYSTYSSTTSLSVLHSSPEPSALRRPSSSSSLQPSLSQVPTTQPQSNCPQLSNHYHLYSFRHAHNGRSILSRLRRGSDNE